MVNIGVDVSKDSLDVFVEEDRKRGRFTNDEAGIEQLVSFVAERQVERIVLEATGGYERGAVAALAAAKLPVLARFAAMVKPEPRPLLDKASRDLQDLIQRRRQVVQMLVSETLRLQNHKTKGTVRTSLEQSIAFLKQLKEQLETDLDQAVQSSPVWRDKEDLLRSVPGVGSVVSRTLLFVLPELGTLNRKEIASLAELAPFARDSGTLRGKRTTWGGRASVRSALYMAAVASLRCNAVLRGFFDRLVQAGKPKKLALIACARKLLTTLNAMLRTHSAWSPPTLSPQKGS